MKNTSILVPIFKKIDTVIFGFEDYAELSDLTEGSDKKELENQLSASESTTETDEDLVVIRSIN